MVRLLRWLSRPRVRWLLAGALLVALPLAATCRALWARYYSSWEWGRLPPDAPPSPILNVGTSWPDSADGRTAEIIDVRARQAVPVRGPDLLEALVSGLASPLTWSHGTHEALWSLCVTDGSPWRSRQFLLRELSVPWQHASIEQLHAPSEALAAALSHDGTRVAYFVRQGAAEYAVWLQPLGGGRARRIPVGHLDLPDERRFALAWLVGDDTLVYGGGYETPFWLFSVTRGLIGAGTADPSRDGADPQPYAANRLMYLEDSSQGQALVTSDGSLRRRGAVRLRRDYRRLHDVTMDGRWALASVLEEGFHRGRTRLYLIDARTGRDWFICRTPVHRTRGARWLR